MTYQTSHWSSPRSSRWEPSRWSRTHRWWRTHPQTSSWRASTFRWRNSLSTPTGCRPHPQDISFYLDSFLHASSKTRVTSANSCSSSKLLCAHSTRNAASPTLKFALTAITNETSLKHIRHTSTFIAPRMSSRLQIIRRKYLFNLHLKSNPRGIL